MKKTVSLLLALCMMLFLSVQSLAATAVSEDEVLEVAYGKFNTPTGTTAEPLATGLIIDKKLFLAKTSTQLLISAKTKGSADVTKCGFTYIKLQRLLNGQWTDYTTYCYSDVYTNDIVKDFSVAANAPKGYTYRVICEHYAEKPRLAIFTSSEKIYNETTSLSF